MIGYIRNLVRAALLLPVVWSVGCTCMTGEAPKSDNTSTSSGSSSSSGTGGGDPCEVDCSKFQTPECTVAVCNTGQVIGPLNTCIVVPAPKGSPCDDGKFCTTNDVCDEGICHGGTPSDCGLTPSPCEAVICYEDTKSCDVTPLGEGAECTPTNLCQVNGVCHIGDCVGEPKDCTFSPLSECNKVACEPATGKCKGTPDIDKEDASCVLSGDLCSSNKTCKAGQCLGGTPKDCSAFNVGCEIGVCDATNGICGPVSAPIGTACTDGIAECQVGACDAKGKCASSVGPNGVACNDHNACTKADTCVAGTCAGGPVAGCQVHLQEGFEVCANGWTFGGDWQCGTPANVGPLSAHTGNGVIATKVAGFYSVSQNYDAAFADSPPIDLTLATNPSVSFWAWDYTEGGNFDGWNLNVSTNGGQSFTQVMAVNPPYSLMIAGKPAWGGDHSAEGWQNYRADLTPYIGQPIILRFAFRSDGATVYPGVYVDDVVVAEPLQDPLFITTPSPLPDVFADKAYATKILKTGGTSNSVWSVKPVLNAAWISIDPSKGVLSGTPSLAEVGPVIVIVHVEEPALPSNFAEKTFSFNVTHAAYYTSFEGACPNGWTLTGDWQCGVPVNVGPATAFVGTQCLGTQIAGPYSDLQSYAGTTATSPDIDLAGLAPPTLTFRMWIDTEGVTYDGANLKISTDGGMNYSVLDTVMPPYNLMIASENAWGGHQSALGWQEVQADLSAYAGQIIRLRFAFRSDSSGTFPGVYIDDILVN